MQVKVILYSILRKKLPAQTKGRAMLEMPEGSSIADVLARLEIQLEVVTVLNGQVERDKQHILQDGDELQIFHPVGGG